MFIQQALLPPSPPVSTVLKLYLPVFASAAHILKLYLPNPI